MVAFWIAAGGMALAVAAFLARAALRPGERLAPAAAADIAVYRAQLAEIERDAARGTVPAEEAARLRAEVARRLLEADRALAAAPAASAPGPGWLAAALAGVAVVAGGYLGYARLGASGAPDLPRADRLAAAETAAAARPAQSEAEASASPPAAPPAGADAEYVALVARLRDAVATRPDDVEGHRLLALHESRLGNAVAARRAQARVVELAGDAATSTDLSRLARLMVAAAGGVVTPEAEAVAARAIELDPTDAEALFLAGLARLQVGRPDEGAAWWIRYLAAAPPDHPFRAEVAARIETLADIGGQSWRLAALPAGALDVAPASAAPGPTDEDIAAAETMSPEERSAMAEGMVARLSSRLAEGGGPATDWAMLIRALGVLGQADRARAVFQEAQTAFAGRPEDLAAIEEAARGAGLLP